ncbi:hypothetical protein SAMN05216326_12546 [Nitrosomonas marina]|uniref:Uncharacterized protein n=1 Tax=Nitrosomonas marina TaxID=917 RepID=A0A1I0E7L7_9PROT|nr:hypothetical protein [Nitrosomonas marina]SET40982.1 hypothetical protein SAMN05216326_12546 [Nitrosomonas marina]
MDVEEMIDHCMLHSDDLTDWEADFVDSLQNQLDDGRNLSDRQVDKLNQIYEGLD